MVVLADTSQWESSAVILRSTTVLAFRPSLRERPLSCNLNNAEVFSCVIGKEDETALSIIDPVTINIEIWGRGDVLPASKGLLDIKDEGDIKRILDIQLQQLNVRLSYHDAIMFKHILNSLPKQAQEALSGAKEENEAEERCDIQEPANVRALVEQLTSLGFSAEQCLRALQESENKLDDAAIWLTMNASPEVDTKSPVNQMSVAESQAAYVPNSSVSFSSIQVKTSCISLVVIDDCKDADCPLLELSLASVNLKQRHDGLGSLFSIISASYYNRMLSSWEPAVEPWHCSLDWSTNAIGTTQNVKTSVNLKSTDLININVTTSMLELFKLVQANWGEDYYNLSSGHDEAQSPAVPGTPPAYRRRTPFVPYALHNQTGCPLMFFTSVVDVEGKKIKRFREYSGNRMMEDHPGGNSWKSVGVNETLPFLFATRSKQRHQNTHHHQLHQVVLRVEGWKEAKPVTVDKIGTFFRNVSALRNASSLTEVPPARIVFEVRMHGSAQKLIIVRSALEIENRLSVPIRIRLENTALKVADVKEMEVSPETKVPIPLLYCWANLMIRPFGVSGSSQWKFSSRQVHWCHILDPVDNTLDLHQSDHSVNPRIEPYRYSSNAETNDYFAMIPVLTLASEVFSAFY